MKKSELRNIIREELNEKKDEPVEILNTAYHDLRRAIRILSKTDKPNAIKIKKLTTELNSIILELD